MWLALVLLGVSWLLNCIVVLGRLLLVPSGGNGLALVSTPRSPILVLVMVSAAVGAGLFLGLVWRQKWAYIANLVLFVFGLPWAS